MGSLSKSFGRNQRMRLRPAGARVVAVAREKSRILHAALCAKWGEERSANFLCALAEFGRWTRARREAERP